MYVDTADGECVDVHYGIGGGTSSTRELDIRVCLKHIYDRNWILVYRLNKPILHIHILFFRLANLLVAMKWEVSCNTSYKKLLQLCYFNVT